MILSPDKSLTPLETCHSTLYTPSTEAPLMSWEKIQGNPVLQVEYIRISETQTVPKSHVLKNLRQMGAILFNNHFSTNTCLHIIDKEGNSDQFWVHDFYFVQDSRILWDLTRKSTPPTSPTVEEYPHDLALSSNAISGINHVNLNVSYVECFAELLQWIYTRDDDTWLRSLNNDNFEKAMENVALLRLSQDAYYVLARYYEDI
ncbi:hypothetical protein K7432_003265 [Basidiobolus ranarum]|uniref:Uncharacterized protein n=1 Tax=Basidiobolus ranarum TaxID=34480 RepID=A0ABR2W704_9FUNG